MLILVARQRAGRTLPVLTGLQDDGGDFDGAEHDPGDRSAVLSSDPKTDGGAEAKDCACPSAGHRGRFAQYFQYSFHSITPWKRATNLDRESRQIGAPPRSERRKTWPFIGLRSPLRVDKNALVTYRYRLSFNREGTQGRCARIFRGAATSRN